MNKTLILLFSLMLSVAVFAQNSYSIAGAGQGKSGKYLVKVTMTAKNSKNYADALTYCAVHGVMFRGFSGTDDYVKQAPIVADPNVRQTKSKFFDAFFSEKKYLSYANLNKSSVSTVKVKSGYEISGLILVDKESLQHYLEESGIIQGFSNLW